jgi:hypothetical protein
MESVVATAARRPRAMKLLYPVMCSDALRATTLISLMVGGVFLSEGIQELLEPAS